VSIPHFHPSLVFMSNGGAYRGGTPYRKLRVCHNLPLPPWQSLELTLRGGLHSGNVQPCLQVFGPTSLLITPIG
jgi:hypothetical protein